MPGGTTDKVLVLLALVILEDRFLRRFQTAVVDKVTLQRLRRHMSPNNLGDRGGPYLAHYLGRVDVQSCQVSIRPLHVRRVVRVLRV